MNIMNMSPENSFGFYVVSNPSLIILFKNQ